MTTNFDPIHGPALPETVEQARRARVDFVKYVARAAAAEQELATLKQAAKTVCTAIYNRNSSPARLYLAIYQLAGLIKFNTKEN